MISINGSCYHLDLSNQLVRVIARQLDHWIKRLATNKRQVPCAPCALPMEFLPGGT